jgi:peptidoglycan hydrolase CwlO-like protein
MNQEPELTELNGDERDPATKADVRAVQKQVQAVQEDVDKLAQATGKTFQRVEADIAELKGDVKSLKADVQSLKSGQAAILNVVEGIDAQLKEHRTHPARIKRLERSVFRG